MSSHTDPRVPGNTHRVALSIVAPNGTRIAEGRKTLEVRSWQPDTVPLRDLVIVENDTRLSDDRPEDPEGRAVALVDVLEVHPWRPDEVKAACSSGWRPGYFAWVLGNVRVLPPGPAVPARLGLYTIDPPPPPSSPHGFTIG
jgi:hypothetical protein